METEKHPRRILQAEAEKNGENALDSIGFPLKKKPSSLRFGIEINYDTSHVTFQTHLVYIYIYSSTI